MPTSENSCIATNNSANYLNDLVSRFGLEQHIDNEDNQEMAFDLSHQVTLHIGADCGGILGDTSGDSGTIKTDCSVVTLGTIKDYLKPRINYLLVPTVNSNQNLALDGSQAVSQAAGQLTNQFSHQSNHLPDHHSISQPTL